MTDIRVAPRAGKLRRGTGTIVLTTSLLLAGCANLGPGAGAPKLRVYAVDLAGAAKLCDVPTVHLVAGGTSNLPMKLANDGGWCAIPLHQDGPKPFEAGLLTSRPSHGTILIHEVGDETRIDYTPDRGFAGNDTFAVKLIPGSAIIQVAVTVTAEAPRS